MIRVHACVRTHMHHSIWSFTQISKSGGRTHDQFVMTDPIASVQISVAGSDPIADTLMPAQEVTACRRDAVGMMYPRPLTESFFKNRRKQSCPLRW